MFGRPWSADEDALLARDWGRVPRAQLAQRLGRSLPSAAERARRIGLTKSAWSAEEDAYLRSQYAHRTAAEIGAHLGRGEDAVKLRASRMGLVKKRRWTRHELDILEARYPATPVADLAEELDRTPRQLHNKARRMGIYQRPPLSPEALELLLQLKDDPGIVEYYVQTFGVSRTSLHAILQRAN